MPKSSVLCHSSICAVCSVNINFEFLLSGRICKELYQDLICRTLLEAASVSLVFVLPLLEAASEVVFFVPQLVGRHYAVR
jgi:hypothetical protein